MNDELIYIVIPTTKERRGRLRELLDSIEENTEGMNYSIVIFENELGGWVPAVHKALSGINGFVVLLGSDIVVKKDWLKILWQEFIRQFTDRDGAAQPFDEINNGRLCQHPLAHSETIKKYLDRDFIHNFSDNYMTILLQREGKYLYVPEAKIEHKHFINKKAEKDKTYEIVFSSFERDRKVFERKMDEIERKNREDKDLMEDGDYFIA